MPESEAEHLASWEEAGNALSYFLCQRGQLFSEDTVEEGNLLIRPNINML